MFPEPGSLGGTKPGTRASLMVLLQNRHCGHLQCTGAHTMFYQVCRGLTVAQLMLSNMVGHPEVSE